MEGTDFDVFAEAQPSSAITIDEPSGIAIGDGKVYVSDHRSGRIYAFDLLGNLVDYIDLSPVFPDAGLSGLAVDAAGRLYVTMMNADQVLRLSAMP